MNKKELQINGYEAVIQLFREYPNWMPIVLAAFEEASEVKSSRFAGAWVLERAKKHGVHWVPNLKKLVAYGILQKEGDSSRGGRRAYYSMPDKDGVQKAINEINVKENKDLYSSIEIRDSGIQKRSTVKIPFYINLASCGSPNLSEAHIDDYIEIDSRLVKPGNNYYLVRADGDSMNLAGINNGDFVLVRVQNYADVGQKIVACLDNGVTIKELQRRGDYVVLMPRSDNPKHKPIILSSNPLIQGIVVATIPSFQ